MLKNLTTIIIPVFNGERSIGWCLDSLETQTVPRDRYEIILVDDGSTDNTADIVKRRDNIILRTQANQGPAAARNNGARAAKGEIILFIDADCIAAENWVEEMIKPFNDGDIVGVKGVYRTTQRELTAKFVQIEYEQKYERMKRFPSIDFIDTYSAGFRKDVFLKYGGYDTSFPTATVEDQEFSFRLSRDGHKMVFQPSAVVCHLHQSTWRGYFRRKYLIAYWKILVLKKHPQKIGSDSHTPQILKVQILLTYWIGISLLGTPLSPIFFSSALLGAVLFLISALPLSYFALKKNTEIALWTPVFLLVRSLAFCCGLICGIFCLIPFSQNHRGSCKINSLSP